MSALYSALADAVLLLHAGVVLFVVGGLLLVVASGVRNWAWASSPWFRLLHLAAIGVVVLEAWVGVVCPLTTLESWLRQQAGQFGYGSGFIEHWVGRFLFYEAPPWVFTVLYSAFGLLVLAAWRLFPPSRPSRSSGVRPSANRSDA